MRRFVELLIGLLRDVGVEIDWGQGRQDDLRGVRTARTPAQARDLLERLARRLELEPSFEHGRVVMTGRYEDLPVVVDVAYERADDQIRFSLAIEISAQRPLPGPMTVTSPELAPPGAWMIGDPRLDKACRITGAEASTLLALSPGVREYLVGVGGQLEVDATELRFEATRAATFLPAVLSSLVALCRMLEQTPAVSPEHLAARFDKEPLAPVRSRLLGALIQSFPSDSHTRAACRRGVDDSSARIRLKSALHLGADGRFCLRALVVDPAIDPNLRLAAARRVDAADDWSLEQLESQLSGTDDEALAAARVLGRLGRPRSLRPITALSRESRRPRRLREAAQQAVARIELRNPQAQHGHLSLLGEDGGGLSLRDDEGAVSLDDSDD